MNHIFTQVDRSMHLSLSVAITLILFLIFYHKVKGGYFFALIMAVYVTQCVGICYELYQVFVGLYKTVSYKDLLFNLLGSFLAVIIILASYPGGLKEIH